MYRKGQITIFIILGMLILVLMVIFYSAKSLDLDTVDGFEKQSRIL